MLSPPLSERDPLYVPVRNISTGGMGTVDLVVRRERQFVRFYALKRLLPELLGDVDCRAMFADEARIAGLIHHPNVVGVLDVGEDAKGPYLLMDYVDGVSLSHILETVSRRRALLPLQVCLAIAAQVADGLHATHSIVTPEGAPVYVVHRDVSPTNILLGYDGVVRLTDFGVARAASRPQRTAAGVLKGTLGYMSPEQLFCAPLDHRSDLFAFGIIFYEVLTGRRLYGGEDHAAILRAVREPPPDVSRTRSDVPAEVLDLLGKLLAKKREHRPSRALDVARQLKEALGRVIAAEGSLELQDYLQREFGPRRDLDRRRLAADMAQLATNPIAKALPKKPSRWIPSLASVGATLVGIAYVLATPTPPSEPTPASIPPKRVSMIHLDREVIEAPAPLARAEPRPATKVNLRASGPAVAGSRAVRPRALPRTKRPAKTAAETRRRVRRTRAPRRTVRAKKAVPLWSWP